MHSLIKKSKDLIKEKGLSGLLFKVLDYLKYITLGRLDIYLFKTNKWFFVREFLLNRVVYNILKITGFREGEHQIGRLINIREILKGLSRDLAGDIIEFGSYQGFSLYWLVRFRDKYKLRAKVIGLDSFEGLPVSSTVWQKGKFNDTSYDMAVNNLKNYLKIESLEDNNIYLIKGLFNAPPVVNKLKELSGKIGLVHIDCDLGSSCTVALKTIDSHEKTNPFYLLFDDWGIHSEEIPKSFNEYSLSHAKGYSLENIANTRYTKYFKINIKS